MSSFAKLSMSYLPHFLDLKIDNSIKEETQQILKDNVEITASTFIMGGSGINYDENQDAFNCSIINVNGENIFLIIICDGHGKEGKYYSNEVIKILLNDNRFNIKDNIEKIINDSQYLNIIFEGVDKMLEHDKIIRGRLRIKSEGKNGGTTCTVLIITPLKIISANLGDCEAHIKFNSSIETKIIENGVESLTTGDYFILTTDHSPRNLIDSKRILKEGHHIRYDLIDENSKRILVYELKDDEISEIHYDFDPSLLSYRFNANDDISIYIDSKKSGSTNLSRSFGDKDFGIMSIIPDIKEIYYPKNISFSILTGSDGFFNSYKSEKLNKLFMMDGNYIIKDVYKTTDDFFGKDTADNTTIISFKYFGSH
jgi:serine/threonine protein phosphatase PrpC